MNKEERAEINININSRAVNYVLEQVKKIYMIEDDKRANHEKQIKMFEDYINAVKYDLQEMNNKKFKYEELKKTNDRLKYKLKNNDKYAIIKELEKEKEKNNKLQILLNSQVEINTKLLEKIYINGKEN